MIFENYSGLLFNALNVDYYDFYIYKLLRIAGE